MLVALSLVALVLAPALDAAALRIRGGRAALDGFVLVGVTGLVLAHVLPEAVHAGGPAVVVIAALGMFLPLMVESWTRRAADSAHTWALRLALLGLVAHAGLDGAALYDPQHVELGWAVVLHRIPAALTLWVLLRPSQGTAVASGMLAAMAAATLAGWALGPAVATLDPRAMGAFSGLVAGSLLHVVVHRPHHHPEPDEARFGGVGALLGLLAAGLPALAQEDPEPWLVYAGSTARSGAPAVLLALSLVVLLRRLPLPTPERLARTAAPVAAAWAILRPASQSEIRALDTGSVGSTAFVTAARGPALVATILAMALLGVGFAATLLVGGVALASLYGSLVGGTAMPAHPRAEPPAPLADLVPWLLLGWALIPTAAALPALPLAPLALLALPFQIDAVTSVCIAAGLAAGGTDSGALCAMVLVGSAIGHTDLRHLDASRGRAPAVLAAVGVTGFAAGVGVLVHPVLSAPVDVPLGVPIGGLGVGLLAAILAVPVLREGPRALLGRMGQLPHTHEHQ